MKRLLLCGSIPGLLSSFAFATPTVSVGNKILAPNLPGQAVQIAVTGGDAVQGTDLNVEIADGGTAAGGSISGPTITSANLTGGTIFSSNNSGQQNISSTPQAYSA